MDDLPQALQLPAGQGGRIGAQDLGPGLPLDGLRQLGAEQGEGIGRGRGDLLFRGEIGRRP